MKNIIIVFVLCLGFMGIVNSPVSAQTFDSPAPLGGFAWSPNIGWVSFNGVNYGVSVQPSGQLQGFAWSPHVGWIDFNSQSGCPAGSCAGRVSFTTNAFSGWARALNAGDGWDGWISLGAANHGSTGYGIQVTSTGGFTPASYAWGADVVGWTNFSTAFVTPPCVQETVCTADNMGTETYSIWCELESQTTCNPGEMCVPASGSCVAALDDLRVAPGLIRPGDAVTVSWETTVGLYSSCRVEGAGQTLSGLQNPLGTEITNIVSRGTTFTLYCTLATDGSEVEVDSETVQMIPTIYES